VTDIQTLIQAIPDAQDGNVITSNNFNTIKQVLAAIAGQLGGGVSDQTQAVTLPANFLPVGSQTPWTLNVGFALDGAGSNGWIPLNLPDGAVIQKMVAIGAKRSPATIGFVSLVVETIAGDGGSQNLIGIDLRPAGDPFQITGFPSVPLIGPTALKELQTVDNSRSKYVIHAQTISSEAGTVTINAVRVEYTMR
jgi:hypothetical protein